MSQPISVQDRNVLVELDFMLMSVLNRTTLFKNKG